MPQVYNLTDDNLSLIHSPQQTSFNGALKTMTTRATTTTTANNRLPSNPPLSPLLSSHSNSIHSPTDKDVHMLSPKDELISTPSETSRSGSMTREGGEDVNMDETTTTRKGTPGRETIMENGGGSVDEKHSEIISLLPNSVTSDPGSVPATPATDDDDDDDKITVRTFINNNGAADAEHAKPRSSSAAVSVNGASADEKSKKPASAAVKPKSKRRSPSPEPPPTRPRMQTIRLEIPLGGPENYSIDVLILSKETGQRPPTPPPIKRDDESSESEGDGEGEGEGAAGPSTRAKGKGRGKAGKRNHVAEYYDINDPFIDDSELALDERTYFAQTKQQGFYVSSGEVALLKDKSHKEQRGGEGDGNGNGNGMSPSKKPKSRRNLVPTIIPLAGSQAVNAAVASSAGFSTSVSAPPPPPPPHSQSSKSPTDPFNSQLLTGPGTRETPITLSDTEEGRAAASASASAPPYASISTTASNSTSNSNSTPTNGIVSNGITANDSVSMLKRKASETTANGKKKRKTVEIESFHPELQTALYELKEAISRESFEQKGKFPPSLKPILARTALKAILVGEYNDHFFALMPKLFIYNKFTMTKLIKRTVYPEHQKLLSARQDELVWELKEIADEGFGKTKEDYQKSLEVWERKQQERLKAGVGTGTGATSTEGTPTMHETSLPPPSQAGGGAGAGADSSMELDGIGIGMGIGTGIGTGNNDKDKDRDGKERDGRDRDGAIHSSQHMPVQRFRLNERMKNIIWELVVLCNESVRIENEKNTLENSTVQVSDQGARKVLYQKIVAAFPEGWMTSSQISREVSVMKKRYEAQQAEGVS